MTATIRNDAGTLFGNWNADAIKAIYIRSDSGNVVSLGTQAPSGSCVPITQACAFDSAGQQWNITKVSANELSLVPTVAGESLAVNGTIPVPSRSPRIRELRDGLPAADAGHAAARDRTEQLQRDDDERRDERTARVRQRRRRHEHRGDVLADRRHVRDRHAAQGAPLQPGDVPVRNDVAPANGAFPATSYYPITFNVTNDSGKEIWYYEFTMPATVNPNVLTPAIASATVNGASQTANYKIYTQNGGNGATADNTLGPNSFAIVAG